MAILMVLLFTILAFSLASTEQCESSPGSSMNLSLHSMKNASGDWIITVDTRRLTRKDNPREFSVNVQHETRKCGRYEIEEHVSMAFAYPSLHDTSIPGTIEPSATTSTTTTAATLSTATATPPAATISTSTTTTLATPTATSTTTAMPSTATISTSTTTSATLPNTTTSTSTTTLKSCPRSGYQLNPEFNCYKAFPSRSEWKTWSEARDQCVRDGGDLMVMETERERREVFIPLFNSAGSWGRYPWVGVYKPQDEDGWMTVNGEPVPSTWWRPGYPVKNAAAKCAFAYYDGLLLNYNCTATGSFICEISL